MDNEKIQSLISQLKGVGLGDEEILDVFYAAFQKGKMDRKDLETLADSLGYELDDDFKEDKTPDPIEGGKPEDVTPEEAKDLKEIKPGESKEEFKEKVDEAKDEMESVADDKKEEAEAHEDEDEEKKDSESEEDKEWDEANKYFKI
jgi:hypothetical protein